MLEISQRQKGIKDSATLALNAKVTKMQDEGKDVVNLTAGQLPFMPCEKLSDSIQSESKFLKSYQYCPVKGFESLQKKALEIWAKERKLENVPASFSTLISNGAKHSLANIFSLLLEPGDEVVLFSPYWLSYPAVIEYFGGKVVSVPGYSYDGYIPSLESFREILSDKTKIVVLNSPANPTGIHFPEKWMKGFAEIMKDREGVAIISDEIYFNLSYFDPAPSYYYQFEPALLERSFIVDGVSKSLALTGLRIGYVFAPKDYITLMGKTQAQLTSGANSLTQRALMHIEYADKNEYVVTVNEHLRKNAEILKNAFRKHKVEAVFYQSNSAFYYLIDFNSFPQMQKKFSSSKEANFALDICNDLLDNHGMALVPTGDFGFPSGARMSLVSPHEVFEDVTDRLLGYLTL